MIFFCIKHSGYYLPKSKIFISNDTLVLVDKFKVIKGFYGFFFTYSKYSLFIKYNKSLNTLYNFYIAQALNSLLGALQGFKSYLSVHGMGFFFLLTKHLLILKLKFTKCFFFKIPKNLQLNTSSKNKKLKIFSKDFFLLNFFLGKLVKLQKFNLYTLKGIFFKKRIIIKKKGKKTLY